MKQFRINNGYGGITQVMVAVERIENCRNGNPQFTAQIWVTPNGTNSGYIWYPKLNGFRNRKDHKYLIKGWYQGIEQVLVDFAERLQYDLVRQSNLHEKEEQA